VYLPKVTSVLTSGQSDDDDGNRPNVANPEFSNIFGSATGRPLSIQSPLKWNEPLRILERQRNGIDTMLHDMLLSCYDFVEVQASLEFEVISYGTPRASLHVGLRFDRIVQLGTQAILF